jgi:4'-phosphopantetheinyl transferase EntD
VAVTESSGALGVGLDLEPDTPLQSGLERLICNEDERSWVNQFNSKDRGGLYKVFFSAKESFYKCQYKTTHPVLDFLDVELTFDLEAGTFALLRTTCEGPQWDLVGKSKARSVESGVW